ncbi:hypothetical protein TNCV_3807281 [Trichonephila clavipes]|nr:hypothetical protein TNCV_3807281 [Trichonephila clavipes]
MTPELKPPLQASPPLKREYFGHRQIEHVSALHQVFSDTRLQARDHEHLLQLLNNFTLPPFGIVVSDADCCKWGLGSNPGDGIDVCKCIVSLRQGGGTLNSRRAASLLVRLVERKERWEAPKPSGVSPVKLGLKRAKSYCNLYGVQSYV